ncbi:type 1 glutamine amidotransferase [Metallosphaera tengchongensis]|uniref:Type 1 glutamine amidotransferase n=1 Tax=Metallosphaera tengchongensis TaxID=1532350 RepID=A0A6N0NQV0_9CREN|nr:type 1 glutamine amidotransferase [Metallosphaera tengchongensis]QKQ99071.1 type 1 glutamine amidotransferase [Metallosphaera tengchongensis]
MLVVLNHPEEGPGTLKEMLTSLGFDVKEKHGRELTGKEDPDDLVVMGGPMGVYEAEKYPFLIKEVNLIRRALSEGRLVLGICLGSQLLSFALGGDVRKGSFGTELGVGKVKLLDEFKERIGDEVEVFHFHGDTFTIPMGASLLAYSDKYFQAFYAGKALGLQFHVEVDGRMIKRWAETYGLDTKLVEEVKEREEEFRSTASIILKTWLERSGR